LAYIEWLHKGRVAREQAGGKGASLSELIAAGFPVPHGFCVNAEGYRHFADETELDSRIASLLDSTDGAEPAAIGKAAEQVCALFDEADLPDDLRDQIAEGYDHLVAMAGLACAVRSSAISEDGASASFAGLYASYLNVRGITEVLDAVRRCYASLWSDRAIRYRSSRGGASSDEAMAVVIMGLVPSETSGIAFTAHPVTGARDQVVINASWGLGEAIVSGRVTPDSFVVQKESFALLEREIYAKDVAVYPHPDGGGTIERTLPRDRASAPSLSDDEACEVARIATRVESHYGSPQDIEWGLAGGQLFLLQSRPITTLG
jgi:phosphoenolpyruvate synthase/pyruvate phosphate dikinase